MTDDVLAERLRNVQHKIKQCAEKAGRDVRDIQLIAVSKTRSLIEVQQVAALGHTCFGENTIQDAMTKIPSFELEADWHFIGHLQSKKAGKLPGYFQWIHSVDSIKLAQKLSTAMNNHTRSAVLNCLIQVNVTGEISKSGLLPEHVMGFLSDLLNQKLPCLQWRGLMTIGIRGDEQQTRQAFAQLKKLQQDCQKAFNLTEFNQLSMGMSDDYGLAIEEGSTMVRVGTSIFGER
ncbi:MAG: YggS family pyridoxal phosphate-dependent enzyme [Gammaproteobacteria bacterium]|nr:MAG: YggS family pyridoxal phosphate-dependent enzyme [Gammaproteobacteria bacterium]